MDNNKFEKKIQINRWLLKARWLYIVGIFLVGLVCLSASNYGLSLNFVVLGLMLAVIVNLLNYPLIKFVQEKKSYRMVFFLSVWQVAYELVFFTVIFYLLGGLESLAAFSFLLPIVTAGYFFGTRGALLASLCASILVFGVVTMEFASILEHKFIYGERTIHYESYSRALSYVFSFIIYFFIIGIYSGHISSLLINKEELLSDKVEKLDQESNYRKNEWSQLDRTAKLLVKRDRELTEANHELDKKVKELQHSEVAMMKAFRDLQEGKKALENERNRTNAIIENIIDPVIVINTNNEIDLLNQSARVVFNFSDDDFGKTISAENNFSMNNFREISNAEFVVNQETIEDTNEVLEELVINIGGQEVTYKVITAKVVDKKNEFLGTMKIFYNVTREKMIDKLKSEFISIAAHQLRTPLSAIKWVIKMVLDGDVGPLNDEQIQLLSKGYKSNERIIILVNDMLNVSRIEEGRFGINLKKGDISGVLDTVLDSIGKLMENKNQKLLLDKDSDLPELMIDDKKMTLVIQNLVENAIKYSPENGKIGIKMYKDGQFVKVRVKDNGIGIPKSDQVKLFSKFYRAENAVRLQTEGSGLGLFIVKNILKAHGGDISFKSEEGIGTEFTINLPIEFNPEKAKKI